MAIASPCPVLRSGSTASTRRNWLKPAIGEACSGLAAKRRNASFKRWSKGDPYPAGASIRTNTAGPLPYAPPGAGNSAKPWSRQAGRPRFVDTPTIMSAMSSLPRPSGPASGVLNSTIQPTIASEGSRRLRRGRDRPSDLAILSPVAVLWLRDQGQREPQGRAHLPPARNAVLCGNTRGGDVLQRIRCAGGRLPAIARALVSGLGGISPPVWPCPVLQAVWPATARAIRAMSARSIMRLAWS